MVSYVMYLHMSFSESLGGFSLHNIHISHLESRWVVSHYIYLNISFSQPLGEGFSLYISF